MPASRHGDREAQELLPQPQVRSGHNTGNTVPADQTATITPAAGISRRRFLTGCAGSATLLWLPRPALAKLEGARSLTLFNLHTDERLRVAYWVDGRYDHGALSDLAHLLRDHRADERHPIDPGLLDQLHRLQQQVGPRREIQVISGYRSPSTNASLRQASNGVAKRSLHMQGRAIDIRVPQVETEELYRAAKALRGGGVGLYRKSRFVHLDTGRVRSW